MIKNTLRFKYLIIFFINLVFALTILTIPSQAIGQDSSLEAQMINLKLNVSDTTNYKISGTIEISNNSNKGIDQSSLVVKLLMPGRQKTTTFSGQNITQNTPAQLINFVKTPAISLQPNQKNTQNFELSYPSAITTGDYQLVAEIIDQKSNSQGVLSQKIALVGLNSFLEIDAESCFIKVNKQDYHYFEGPNIQNSDSTVAFCVVKNPSQKDISGKISFQYSVNSVANNPISPKQIDNPAIVSIKANQQQTITWKLPAGLSPQVYEGLFQVVNDFDQKISTAIPFRWIITGPAASIANIVSDKSYYPKESVAKITLDIRSSPDLSWRGGNAPFSSTAGTDLLNAKLNVKVTNSSGTVCGEKNQDLPSTKDQTEWNQLSLEIPMKADCLDPQIEAKVLGDNNSPLAELKYQMRSTDADLKLANAPARASVFLNRLPMWSWIIAVIILIAVVSLIIYIKKKRKKTPPTEPPQQPPAPKVATMAAILFLAGSGLLIANQKLELFPKMTVFAQQAKVLMPMNTTDSTVKNLTLQTTGPDRSYWTLGHEVWGNARDFSQNNTGGDSQISVDAGCEKINITVKGSAASSFTCSNWGPGLIVFPFIDGQAMKPQNITSGIGNEIFNPAPGNYGPNNFDVHQYNNGPREASFSLLPTGDQKIGPHTVTLKIGNTLVIKHSEIEQYNTTFENSTNCNGTGPCYIEVKYNYVCKGPNACNEACTNKDECVGNKEGCTECLPSKTGEASGSGTLMTCQQPPACNASCDTQEDCATNKTGCTVCRPDTTGKNSCQPPPPACNAACSADKDCFGNKDGCNSCINGACIKPPACNDSCTTDRDCTGTKDGCSACVPNSAGTGKVCSKPPACGTGCVRDDQCAGSKDGCVECAADSTGKNICQTPFNEAMCKCDGFNALNLTNAGGGNLQFEAFAKVEGQDVSRAKVQDMKFTLYKSAKNNPNVATPVASGTLVPQIVESSAGKVRYRSVWSVPPPAPDPNAVYRVGADPTCVKKPLVSSASASLNFSSASNLLSSDNSMVLGTELNYSTSKLVQNLELGTLKDGYFTRMVETDSCKFIKFEYGQF